MVDSVQDLVNKYSECSTNYFITQLQDAFDPERIVCITEADEDHIKG